MISKTDKLLLSVVPKELRYNDKHISLSAVANILCIERNFSIESAFSPDKASFIRGELAISSILKSLIIGYQKLSIYDYMDETADKRALKLEGFDNGISIQKMYNESIQIKDFYTKAAQDLQLPIDAQYYTLLQKTKNVKEWIKEDLKIGQRSKDRHYHQIHTNLCHMRRKDKQDIR